jgi:hypothetical protein
MEIKVEVENITLASTVGGSTRRWNDEYEEWESDSRTLADVIADHAVDLMSRDTDWSSRTREVRESRKKAVDAAITAQVEKALSEPFVLTDEYGTPKNDGKEVSLRSLIATAITDFFTVPRGDSYSAKETGAQKVINTAINTYVSKELNAVMKAELDKAKAAIHTAAGALIARNIDKLTPDKL